MQARGLLRPFANALILPAIWPVARSWYAACDRGVSASERQHDPVRAPAVTFSVRLVAGADVRRELAALVGPTRAQPGCLRCELLHDVANPSAVELVEEWGARADLDRHLRSDDCRRLLAVAELAAEAPSFRIDTIAAREGIEAIAAARGQSIDLPTRPDSGTPS